MWRLIFVISLNILLFSNCFSQWKNVKPGIKILGGCYTLQNEKLYLLFEDGLYITTNFGDDWEKVYNLPDATHYQISSFENGDLFLYYASQDTVNILDSKKDSIIVMKSTDNGVSWNSFYKKFIDGNAERYLSGIRIIPDYGDYYWIEYNTHNTYENWINTGYFDYMNNDQIVHSYKFSDNKTSGLSILTGIVKSEDSLCFCRNSKNELFISKDKGKSWDTTFYPYSSVGEQLYTLNYNQFDKKLYLSTNKKLITSDNLGENWNEPIFNNGVSSLALNDKLVSFVSKEDNKPDSVYIFKNNFLTNITDTILDNITGNLGVSVFLHMNCVFLYKQNEGLYRYTGEALSVDNSSYMEKIELFPNPATDILHLKNIPENSIIEVYNIIGQKIISTDQSEFNISFIQSGLYNIIVIANGNLFYKSCIIKY
jgi:hypothetical protein